MNVSYGYLSEQLIDTYFRKNKRGIKTVYSRLKMAEKYL